MENRIIKFRGKRRGGTEWIYGDLNHIDGKVYIFDRSADANLNSPDWFEVDPKTVGQLTGLHDKNGKEICEGDIIRFYYNRLNNMEVRFENGHYLLYKYNLAKCSIIGNIYENPELLKKS